MERLAAQAGVSKVMISQIEHSKSVPSLHLLFNIISALELDPQTFFDSMSANLGKNGILHVPGDSVTEGKKNSGRVWFLGES